MGSRTVMLLLTALLGLGLCPSQAFQLASEDGPCPMPWVDGTLVGMGCLLFSSDASMTWNEADVFCQREQSAKLVSIETEEQVYFVKMLLGMLEDHESRHEWWTSGKDEGRTKSTISGFSSLNAGLLSPTGTALRVSCGISSRSPM